MCETFAVEVGAREYLSKPVLCCFKKLGFNNNLIEKTIKKLIKSSTEYAFCIWLARNKTKQKNNKEWTPSAANCNLNDSLEETCNSSCSMSHLKQSIKPVSKSNPFLQFLSIMSYPLKQSSFGTKNLIAYVTSS